MIGNQEFNNQLNSKLRKYYENQTTNIYRISVNSIEKRKTIAKDATGKISDYELIVEAEETLISLLLPTPTASILYTVL